MPTPPLKLFVKDYKGLLIAFDPGECTGLAVFEDGQLIYAGQLDTHTVVQSVPILLRLLDQYKGVKEITLEDYRVYAWKVESHAWDNMHTSRLIGCIETLCTMRNIPYTKRVAQGPKNFVTDEKLKDWGLYQKGQRHSRDAMRHALFHMIFAGKEEPKIS